MSGLFGGLPNLDGLIKAAQESLPSIAKALTEYAAQQKRSADELKRIADALTDGQISVMTERF